MGREHAGFESIATGAFLCKIQWFYYRCWQKLEQGQKEWLDRLLEYVYTVPLSSMLVRVK